MYLDLHRWGGEARVRDGSGREFRADVNPNATVHAVTYLTRQNSNLSIATDRHSTNKEKQ